MLTGKLQKLSTPKAKSTILSSFDQWKSRVLSTKTETTGSSETNKEVSTKFPARWRVLTNSQISKANRRRNRRDFIREPGSNLILLYLQCGKGKTRPSLFQMQFVCSPIRPPLSVDRELRRSLECEIFCPVFVLFEFYFACVFIAAGLLH